MREKGSDGKESSQEITNQSEENSSYACIIHYGLRKNDKYDKCDFYRFYIFVRKVH